MTASRLGVIKELIMKIAPLCFVFLIGAQVGVLYAEYQSPFQKIQDINESTSNYTTGCYRGDFIWVDVTARNITPIKVIEVDKPMKFKLNRCQEVQV